MAPEIYKYQGLTEKEVDRIYRDGYHDGFEAANANYQKGWADGFEAGKYGNGSVQSDTPPVAGSV